jgi:hypothetical protein
MHPPFPAGTFNIFYQMYDSKLSVSGIFNDAVPTSDVVYSRMTRMVERTKFSKQAVVASFGVAEPELREYKSAGLPQQWSVQFEDTETDSTAM